MQGWLNINKAKGIGSTTITNIAKRVLECKVNKVKIGHAGTLDPMATGVLPIAIGKCTKQISLMMDAIKEYEFKIKFGSKTDSGDAEGKIIESQGVTDINNEILDQVTKFFIGKITQIPPKYSAIKINGKRAYDLARSGVEFEIKPREIEIYSLNFISLEKINDELFAKYVVCCSKGTYIRSLAEDICEKINNLGHVVELHRKRVGPFFDHEAIAIESLTKDSIIPSEKIFESNINLT